MTERDMRPPSVNNELTLENIKCICGSDNYSVLYPARIDLSSVSSYEFSARRKRSIQHYRILRCNNCELIRSSPVISENDLVKLYKDCKLLNPLLSYYAAEAYGAILSRFISRLKNRQNISLLEIGCGKGDFLQKAKKMGFNNIVGIEPSRDSVEGSDCDIKGHIINDIFNSEDFYTESFDVVASFHVIDHLFDPKKFVTEAYRIIKPGGLILLVCHDINAIANKILREHSPVLDIEHIFLFNKSTLRKLIESSGFSVIDIEYVVNTYPLSYWLQYIPMLHRLVPLLPKSLSSRLVKCSAGNIYLCAQKQSA